MTCIYEDFDGNCDLYEKGKNCPNGCIDGACVAADDPYPGKSCDSYESDWVCEECGCDLNIEDCDCDKE